LALGGRSRRLFVGVVLAVLAVALVLPFIYNDADRIYNGTDVRMAEILLGVVLAVVYGQLSGRETIRNSQIIKVLGLLALAGSVAAWMVVEQTDTWLYHGGFAGYALLSVLIIAAATQKTGPVPALLSWRPIMYLGIISYGVYLYHWPIYLWFDADSTGLDGLSLFTLRLMITFAVAWLSFHYLETPIRRGVRPGVNLDQKWIPIGAGVLVLGAGILFLSPLLEDDEPEFEFASTPTGAAPAETDGEEPTEATEPTAVAEPDVASPAVTPTETAPQFVRSEPPTLMVMGDSVAENLFLGLERQAEATGSPIPLHGNLIFAGCGIATAPEGSINLWGGNQEAPVCRNDYDAVAQAIETHQPDVVVLPVGPVDLLPRRFPGDDGFLSADNPIHSARLRDAYRDLQETVLDSGAAVLWVNMPCMSDERLELTSVELETIETVNEMIAGIATTSPAASVFDLNGEVCPTGAFLVSYEIGGVVDDEARADGVHFSDFTANALSEQIVAAALLVPIPPVP
jgi:hypothetical protein